MTGIEQLGSLAPPDNSWQSDATKEALKIVSSLNAPRFLDLGCGDGLERKSFPGVHWTGLDIAESPGARKAAGTDKNVIIYDGVNIPFPDMSFDVVYSDQVMEHVRFPEPLIKQVLRVLRPGGVFVGSTSHLEPFHAESIQNFTPYGFAQILSSAGFENLNFRAGIDGPTLVTRRLLSGFKLEPLFQLFFSHESPLNLTLELLTRLCRIDARRRTAVKLLFCGQFIFSAQRPGASTHP
jgi:SAM-dependent methyltransferase